MFDSYNKKIKVDSIREDYAEEEVDLIVEELKILLDSDEDEVIKIYFKMALNTILGYCNYLESCDVFNLNTVLLNAVKQLTIINYRNRGKENITQMSQGSRSMTLKSAGGSYKNSLPSEIEALCKPYRRLKVMG